MQSKLFLLLLFILISCKEEKSKENVSKEKQQIELEKKEPQTVALEFYKWYLKDIYLKQNVEIPDIVLNKDSIYVLDTTKHKKFLETSGYFSTTFYENEIVAFKNCENQLKQINWKEVEESGAINPADFLEGNECEFTHYMVWTNGQGETLNKAQIDKVSAKENYALVILKLSDSLQKRVFSKPEITLIKENGDWKISKINVIK